MKKFVVTLGAALAMTIFIATTTPALTITAMDNATSLTQSLVGSGVSISNVNYTGATEASGYFTGGTAAGLGFDSGIVLTTGYAANIDGVTNTSDSITGDNNLAGYAPLDTISGVPTYDATVLSFDFISAGDSVFFNYAFGSDEYNEYVGTGVNDTFAFFFEEVNIATLPDGTPVSIDDINNGSNPIYYNDNESGAFAFEYDGFTDMLTASVTGLEAGQLYSITLAIADGGDHVLDSGVFLQAGSFSDTPTDPDDPAPVPEPSTIILLGGGLLGLGWYGRKRKKA